MGNGEPIKSSDYTPLGRVTEYKFCTRLSDVVNLIKYHYKFELKIKNLRLYRKKMIKKCIN